MRRINLWITEKQFRILQYLTLDGQTMTYHVRKALEEYYERNRKNEEVSPSKSNPKIEKRPDS